MTDSELHDRTTDELIDAYLAGDTTADEALQRVHDPMRAADLMVVHGMLGQLAENEEARTEDSLQTALRRIDAAIQPIAWRRFVPFAAAAVLAVAVFTGWWTVSAEHRAVADLLDGHVRHGIRRYNLAIRRDDAALPELHGTADVDGAGSMVLSLPLPPGAPQSKLLYGRNPDGWWIVEADGTISRSSDRSVLIAWVHRFAPGAPIPNVDETLARLEDEYDVTWSVDPSDESIIYHGVLSAAGGRSDDSTPDEVIVRYNRVTSKIRGIVWRWTPAAGPIAKLTEVEVSLAERKPPKKGWFAPETHRDAAADGDASIDEAAASEADASSSHASPGATSR